MPAYGAAQACIAVWLKCAVIALCWQGDALLQRLTGPQVLTGCATMAAYVWCRAFGHAAAIAALRVRLLTADIGSPWSTSHLRSRAHVQLTSCS